MGIRKEYFKKGIAWVGAVCIATCTISADIHDSVVSFRNDNKDVLVASNDEVLSVADDNKGVSNTELTKTISQPLPSPNNTETNSIDIKTEDKETNDTTDENKIDNSKKNNDLLVEDTIDYSDIIEKNKDEEFRNEVSINDGTVIVARLEKDDSDSIENSDWYKSDITDSSILSQTPKNDSKLVFYELKTNGDVWDKVDEINESNDVLIAEPVYIYHTLETGAPTLTDDPESGRQWYLSDQELPMIWNNSLYGDTSGEGTIVAVIDTGVDYKHEDLKDNIWVNSLELLGTEGVDDDGNGYVDDIYGYSFVSNTPDPMDDNGHGTHVAGIIAMADNAVGGVGIAYKSKIMCIKAGQADGCFSSTDIANAIYYAAANGADVINMSFGSYAHSAIVENALQDAFASCVLVAAAGNDGWPTLDALEYLQRGNMYPAAYSYVIGVMAYDESGNIADFSNWDYKLNYGAEYEIAAPGVGLLSVLPGNRYASWSGTSMATPVVAAAAAILRSSYEDKSMYSSRFIMGQIVGATTQSAYLVNPFREYSKLCLKDSLLKSPQPNINVNEVYVFDSTEYSPANNGDGIVQPGETIALAIGLRNQWGAATDVKITCESDGNAGANPYVEYVNGNIIPINDIGTFGTQDNGFIYDDEGIIIGVDTPLLIKISEDTPNDAHIPFYINYLAQNALDDKDETVYKQKLDSVLSVNVQRGIVIRGKISSNTTWTSDNYYIIDNSLLIPRGVTVNVEPGTQIQFWSGDSAGVYSSPNIAMLQVEGTLNLNGTAENPIKLFPGKNYEQFRVEVRWAGNGKIYMDYVEIINPYIDITRGSHLDMKQNYDSICYRYYSDSNVYTSPTTGYINTFEGIYNSKLSNLGNYNIYGKYDTVLFDECGAKMESIEAVNCTFLVNQARLEDYQTGTLQYFTAGMNKVGDMYYTPTYSNITPVFKYNGKKYAVYKFDRYFYPLEEYDNKKDVWFYYGNENLQALRQALAINGGKLIDFDLYESSEDNEFIKKVGEYIYDNYNIGNQYLYFVSDYYYDQNEKSSISSSGKKLSNTCGNQYNPFVIYDVYNTTENVYNEEGEVQINPIIGTSIGNSDNIWNYGTWFIMAEYDESVLDYNVLNPVFDISKMGITQNTKFTNNAILNRLASKNTANWMKLNAGTDRNAVYMVADNYWGTTDSELIQKQLVDFDTNIMFGDYIIDPFLTSPAESTYPCVADLYITDKNGEKVKYVGSGEYDVHVIFNRDMDTSVSPMVTYGSDDPYTDYTVNGTWVNAREWTGKANIRILINQGTQYFRVKDAVAASDSWLTTGTDWGRFAFNIQASGTEALTLQGEGIKGAVYLNWTQDDYDTLAGYNVYRSDSGEEGTFGKLNTSIISLDTKEYYDKKAQSGVKYYYYFTVVDTDFKESKPSNIISAASIDDKAPTIDHYPKDSLPSAMNASINASVYDNIKVDSVSLFYRVNSTDNYSELVMKKISENNYSIQIPAKEMIAGTIEYFILATDVNGNASTKGSEDEPISVVIENMVIVTAVSDSEGEVGEEMNPIITGINFTDDIEIFIDNEKVEYEYLSDKELKIKGYIPKFMGKKNIVIAEDGEAVANYANALTVRDASIYITNENALILKNSSQPQYIYYSTNFAGKLNNYEITYKRPSSANGVDYDNIEFSYCYGSMTSGDWDDVNEYYTYKIKSGSNVKNVSLFYLYAYNVKRNFIPEIVSVKINGVEVENIVTDESKLTFVDENLYVPVESITILMDTSIQYNIGDNIKIEYLVEPINATMRKAVNIRYNSNLVKENQDGTFTAIGSGWAGFELSTNDYSISFEIYIKPEDKQAPTILPQNLSEKYAADCDAEISASIDDENSVKSATLYYITDAVTEYTGIAMKKAEDGSYKCIIPKEHMIEGNLKYYVEASDGKNTGYWQSADDPYVATIVKLAGILSVEDSEGSVGESMQPRIYGINLNDTMEVYVDDEKVDYNFISDAEIDIVGYVPKYMGMKDIIVLEDGERVAYYRNALTVRDDSIFVKNETVTMVTNSDNTQYLYMVSNFEGRINSLEVTFKKPIYSSGESVSYGFSINFGYNSINRMYDEDAQMVTYMLTSSSYFNSGNRLMSFNFGELKKKLAINVVSLKINGVEVSNIVFDASSISYLDSSQIVSVEAVTVDNKTTQNVKFGEDFKVDYSVYPVNATILSGTRYSYDSDYLKYNGDGTFTPIHSGWTSVYVYVDDVGSQNWKQIYIEPIPVTAVSAERSSYSGTVGSKLEITVGSDPIESDADLTYTCYGTEVSVINSSNRGRKYTILLTKEGITTFRVYSCNDSNIYVDIDIEAKPNDTYVDISEDIITLKPGESINLTAEVKNNTGDGILNVSYSASDAQIASVNDDGKITASAEGCTVITAYLEGGGKSDSVIVLVVADNNDPVIGDINMDGQITALDAMLALKLAVNDCKMESIIKIADVNGDGVITALDAMLILKYVTGAITNF